MKQSLKRFDESGDLFVTPFPAMTGRTENQGTPLSRRGHSKNDMRLQSKPGKMFCYMALLHLRTGERIDLVDYLNQPDPASKPSRNRNRKRVSRCQLTPLSGTRSGSHTFTWSLSGNASVEFRSINPLNNKEQVYSELMRSPLPPKKQTVVCWLNNHREATRVIDVGN